MLNMFRKSNIAAWILMGLLIIGLTGFGLGGAVTGLTTQNVASVGDEPISRAQYARGIDAQMRQFAQQTGQNLTPEQMQMFGLDQQVLQRLIANAAITGEARQLGLSAGDANVRDELISMQQFQGITGTFDRDTYRRSLDQYGMSTTDFEKTLRDELSFNILASAISGGVDMPETMSRRILDYYLEERDFTWFRLDAEMLAEPVAEPTEEEIQAYYDANPDAFQSLETRRITYIALTPDALVDGIEVTDEELQDAYDARTDQYKRPERRIVDRITFRDSDQANDARSRIDAGEASFEDIATERGLAETDYQLGGIESSALDASFRDDVFGTDEIGLFGPLETPLGPALIRVNAIIPELITPIDSVSDTLREAVAQEKASAEIAQYIEPVQDLLAGGATLEEIANETPLTLDTLGITVANDGTDMISTDPAFRQQALAAVEGDYPELFDLQTDGIAALRLEAIEPPALLPLEEVRDDLVAQMKQDRLQDALTVLGDEVMAELSEGRSFQTVAQDRGLALNAHDAVSRNEPLEDLPADLSPALFAALKGEVVRVDEFDGVVLAQVGTITAFDPETEENQAQMTEIRAELASQASADLFSAFSKALQTREGVTINQQLINQLLSSQYQ